MTKEQLQEQCDELGIEYDGRWSAERLKAAIEDHEQGEESEPVESAPEPKQAKSNKVRSTRTGRLVIGAHAWAPGQAIEMSESDRKDKRVQHAIRTGVLVEE